MRRETILDSAVANLDVKLQRSPTLHDHGIPVMWYAKCRTEGASENPSNGRLGGLSLIKTSGLPGAERGDPYRSCRHCPVPTSDLHPFIFLGRVLLTFLCVIERLGLRLRGNGGEERQKFVFECVKVKAQKLFRVFLVPALKR